MNADDHETITRAWALLVAVHRSWHTGSSFDGSSPPIRSFSTGLCSSATTTTSA